MSLQFKPLSLVALATTAVLYGCGGDDAIEKTAVYDGDSKTGLWCPSPQIVQTVDADYHPLSADEISALTAAAMARDGADFDTRQTHIRPGANPLGRAERGGEAVTLRPA